MANRKKNSRCTELKKDAFFKKEGRLVWEHIAQTISSRFPDHKRSPDQCRRRWETLTKTYKHIEEYCMETGQDHWQLDEDELSSMKLDTAYRQDWYDIVKQVCSQRKRKEKGDCDLIAAKRIKRSGTCSSPSSVLPECTPGRESLYVTAGQVLICKPASFIPLNSIFGSSLFLLKILTYFFSGCFVVELSCRLSNCIRIKCRTVA
jgi:hypothetical protein